MPNFPSDEWFDQLVRAFNADEEAEAAMNGWRGELAIVVERASGEPFVALAFPGTAGIGGWRRLADEAELHRAAPAYEARASLATWQGLLQRTLDPVQAVLFRQLRVRGDLQPLIARLGFRGLGKRALAAVPTSFER